MLTQDLSRRCIATRGGECVNVPSSTESEAFDNAVDVVELLLAPTDQAPNVRHLQVLHTFNSLMSLAFLIQQGVEVVDEFRQHDDVVMVVK